MINTKTKGELGRRIEYDVEHDLFHPQNIYSDEYITPTFVEYVQKIEKENAELKTKKIPQLERKIASIRGCHSVDIKKLNARIEQVERLKKENAELTKAKEIIEKLLNAFVSNDFFEEEELDAMAEAEQFLKIMLDKLH